MKSYSLAIMLLTIPVLCFTAKAQPSLSDRQKEDIKGDVSSFIEFEAFEYEKWGEEIVELDTLRRIFFNRKGNYEIQQFHSHNADYYYTKFFTNDSLGRAIHVDSWHLNSDVYDDNSGRVIGHGSLSLSLAIKGIYDGRDIYEYDEEGRLKSLTYGSSIFSECRGKGTKDEYNSNEIAKVVYRYEPNGYTITYCDRSGRTRRKAVYTDKGRKMSDGSNTYTYDAKGHILSVGGSQVASNGGGAILEHYGYNKHGDLAIVSTRAVAVKEIELAPWLSSEYKYSGETVYEYEYDANGNWTRRREYKTTPRGKSLEQSLVRKYVYGDYDSVSADFSQKYNYLIDNASDNFKLAIKENDYEALYKSFEYSLEALNTHCYEIEALAHFYLACIWKIFLDSTTVEDEWDECPLYNRACAVTYHCEKAIQMLSKEEVSSIEWCKKVYQEAIDLPIMSPSYQSACHPMSPEAAGVNAWFVLGNHNYEESVPGRLKR